MKIAKFRNDGPIFSENVFKYLNKLCINCANKAEHIKSITIFLNSKLFRNSMSEGKDFRKNIELQS